MDRFTILIGLMIALVAMACAPAASPSATAPPDPTGTPPLPTPTATPPLDPTATPPADGDVDIVDAPIHGVEVEFVPDDPTQSVAIVTSGLPNSCEVFESWSLEQDGSVFVIAIKNTRQVGAQIACAELYGFVETRIPLRTALEECALYGFTVNGNSFSARATPPGGCGDGSIPDDAPAWLQQVIRQLDGEPVSNPPSSVTRYGYNGQTVYFIPQKCCDFFSILYDADGMIIGHPDGGITGYGDGRAADFFDVRQDPALVWQDARSHDGSQVQTSAPIVEARLEESGSGTTGEPWTYILHVTTGLPNGCASFAGYRVNRAAERIAVEISNWIPADPSIMCTEIYRTVDTAIELPGPFETGIAYTVEFGDRTLAFKDGEVLDGAAANVEQPY